MYYIVAGFLSYAVKPPEYLEDPKLFNPFKRKW